MEANGLETLYDADADKVASASIGMLAEGAKTGTAVKTVKLLAQSTGEFTRDELKKDVKPAWTDKAKAEIAAAKEAANGSTAGDNTGDNTNGSGGTNNSGTNNGGGGAPPAGDDDNEVPGEG